MFVCRDGALFCQNRAVIVRDGGGGGLTEGGGLLDVGMACRMIPDRVVDALRKLTDRHLDVLTFSSISYPTV